LEQVTQRRFPPPWSVEATDACFIVRDGNRQALAYVYFEEEPGRRSRRSAAHLLTRDEARRIAANIAKLPAAARAGGLDNPQKPHGGNYGSIRTRS
jgi:hypothetical protein